MRGRCFFCSFLVGASCDFLHRERTNGRENLEWPKTKRRRRGGGGRPLLISATRRIYISLKGEREGRVDFKKGGRKGGKGVFEMEGRTVFKKGGR